MDAVIREKEAVEMRLREVEIERYSMHRCGRCVHHAPI